MSHSNLLIIGFVWPEPNSSAAGSRMLQLIEQFQKQGFDVTFASAAKTSPIIRLIYPNWELTTEKDTAQPFFF